MLYQTRYFCCRINIINCCFQKLLIQRNKNKILFKTNNLNQLDNTSYLGNRDTCKKYTGNGRRCWNTLDATERTPCVDRLCTDNDYSTTDLDCEAFQFGCVTRGTGCIDKSLPCSKYLGTQQTCANFKGLNGVKKCWNVITAVSTSICIDRLCTHNAKLTTDKDCDQFLTGCVTKGTGCVNRQLCKNFLGTVKTCPNFSAIDKPCKGVSNVVASCESVNCYEAPNTADSDVVCDKFKSACQTTGFGCVANVTCEDIQTKAICQANPNCAHTSNCRELFSIYKNYSNFIFILFLEQKIQIINYQIITFQIIYIIQKNQDFYDLKTQNINFMIFQKQKFRYFCQIDNQYKMIALYSETRVSVLIHQFRELLQKNVLGIMKQVKVYVEIGNVQMLLKQQQLMMVVKHYIRVVLLKEMVVLKQVLALIITLQLFVKQLKQQIKETLAFGIKLYVEPKNVQMHLKLLKQMKNVKHIYLIVQPQGKVVNHHPSLVIKLSHKLDALLIPYQNLVFGRMMENNNVFHINNVLIILEQLLKNVKNLEKNVQVMVQHVYLLHYVKDIKMKLVVFMELMEFVDGYLKMDQILQNVFYLKNANKLQVQIMLLVVYFQIHV